MLFSPASALAHVVRVVIDTREPLAGGASFGSAGAYERITGRMFFAFDPSNPHDRQIVDLGRAPRNAQGEVEAWAEFVMLRPVDASRGSGVTLVDVVNRGGMTVGVFHLTPIAPRRPTRPPTMVTRSCCARAHRGDARLAVGHSPGRGGLALSSAGRRCATHPITGLVRSDITVDAPTHTIPLGHVVGSSMALAYPVSDTGDAKNQLTVRDGPTAPRRVIARKRGDSRARIRAAQ